MKKRMDHTKSDQALDALREAINAAVIAGNNVNVVRTVVNDQLFGITRLGGGNVGEMLLREAEMDKELRAYLRKTYPRVFNG